MCGFAPLLDIILYQHRFHIVSVPQGTLSGPKNFLVQINDLQTPCPMFKYVDDRTVFDVCNNSSVPMLQESVDIITDWSIGTMTCV